MPYPKRAYPIPGGSKDSRPFFARCGPIRPRSPSLLPLSQVWQSPCAQPVGGVVRCRGNRKVAPRSWSWLTLRRRAAQPAGASANCLANSLAVATQASCTANNPEDHSHSFSGDQSPVEPPKWTISEPLWKTVIRRRQFHSEFLRKKPCGFLYGFSVGFLWVFVMGLNLFLPWFLCAQNTAKRAP